MARKALKKVNGKLKFLYRQATFLNPACKRLLCNALIQPHFDYGCTSWYPLLSKALKKKVSNCSKQTYTVLFRSPSAHSHLCHTL